MSALAFWLLMLLVVLFVVMLVAVGLAVRSLLQRIHRMAMELQDLSSDITGIVRVPLSAADPVWSDPCPSAVRWRRGP